MSQEGSSSYATKSLAYDDIFKLLMWMIKPKCIVEFGILHGYSLKCFANNTDASTKITAYDIFEKFNGNSAKRDIYASFSSYPNVSIQEGDFYKMVSSLEDASVDILHIDIANDGAVYEFAVDNYMTKLSTGGVMILEGGSEERDHVEWMIKYSKKSIRDTLKVLHSKYDVYTMTGFPSMTIIKKLL
jgi:predicted O-methyltransferase YrrM